MVVVLYSFSIYEVVLKKSRVDVGSMEGRYEVNVFVDGKIYGINEEVDKEGK